MIRKYSFLVLLALALMASCKSSKKGNSAVVSPKGKGKKEQVSKNNSVDDKAETIIKTARSYTGTPYKYGGTSRAGMDCSGLCCESYRSAGITLPRTANDQSNSGKAVKLDELQKGDLVFFTDRKGNKKITHVGMVAEVKKDGSVRFIHASTKLGVVETDLFSDYYKPLIIKAVRIF